MPGPYKQSPEEQAASRERRAEPRLQLVSPLAGHDDSGDDVTLVNFSGGGILVHTTHEATAGQLRHFRFQVGDDGVTTHFTARVVHVMRISVPNRPSYALGLELVAPLGQATREALRKLATLSA